MEATTLKTPVLKYQSEGSAILRLNLLRKEAKRYPSSYPIPCGSVIYNKHNILNDVNLSYHIVIIFL
jgi:hypothetical protein